MIHIRTHTYIYIYVHYNINCLWTIYVVDNVDEFRNSYLTTKTTSFKLHGSLVLWCFVCISWTFQIQQIQHTFFSCVPGKWTWSHFQGSIFLVKKKTWRIYSHRHGNSVETLHGSREWTFSDSWKLTAANKNAWGWYLDTTEVLTYIAPEKCWLEDNFPKKEGNLC